MGLRLLFSAGTGPVECRQFLSELVWTFRAALDARGAAVEAQIEAGGLGDLPASICVWVVGPEVVMNLLRDGWVGTHCLRAPLRGRAQRSRWFVAVTQLDAAKPPPEVGGGHAQPPGAEPEIPSRELSFEAVRARGPGGQHVNKAATAVRVIHLPTGLSVRVESERSQQANRRRAIRLLAAALATRQAAARAADRASTRRMALKVQRGSADWTWFMGEGLLRAPAREG